MKKNAKKKKIFCLKVEENFEEAYSRMSKKELELIKLGWLKREFTIIFYLFLRGEVNENLYEKIRKKRKKIILKQGFFEIDFKKVKINNEKVSEFFKLEENKKNLYINFKKKWLKKGFPVLEIKSEKRLTKYGLFVKFMCNNYKKFKNKS